MEIYGYSECFLNLSSSGYMRETGREGVVRANEAQRGTHVLEGGVDVCVALGAREDDSGTSREAGVYKWLRGGDAPARHEDENGDLWLLHAEDDTGKHLGLVPDGTSHALRNQKAVS
jgi:hypothetical protein